MRGRFLLLAGLGLGLLAGSAVADDRDDCFLRDGEVRLAACTRLIDAQDDVAAVRHQRGLAYLAQGLDSKAVQDFDAALKLDPADAAIFSDRGVARCRLKQYKAAESDFASAIKNNATVEVAYFSRAVCRLRKDALDGALKDFQKVTESSPSDAHAYYGQYLIHTRRKNAQQAISSHYVAVRLEPAIAGTTLELRTSELEPSSGGGGGKKKGKRKKKKAAKCPGYAPFDPATRQCVHNKTKRVVTTHEVSIYFGTDRAAKPGDGRLSYGKERSGTLALGRADVTVPIYRRVGEIERPWSLTSTALHVIGSGENPAKYYVIQDLAKLDKTGFAAGVAEALAAGNDYQGHAFVFIHGYNVSFDDALYRAAQIAADSGFDGVPFVYSWPSAGELKPYEDDRKSAGQAVPHLRAFLEFLVKETAVEKVHLVAHSMGSVVLLNALKELAQAEALPERAKFKEIILAAPDMEAQQFRTLSGALAGFGAGKTLYASSNDLALKASMLGWGGARAGHVPAEGPLIVAGVETIDVSAVNTNILGHSAYADEMKLLIDVGLLLKGLHPPRTRIPLLGVGGGVGGAYWIWPQ